MALAIFDLDETLIDGDCASLWAREMAKIGWVDGESFLHRDAELMAEYGCARMTVSRAMTDLSARALVVRRRRAGTVVAHPPVHSSALVAIPDIQSEVEGRGLTYSHRLLGRIVRPARADEGLGQRVIDGGMTAAL